MWCFWYTNCWTWPETNKHHNNPAFFYCDSQTGRKTWKTTAVTVTMILKGNWNKKSKQEVKGSDNADVCWCFLPVCCWSLKSDCVTLTSRSRGFFLISWEQRHEFPSSRNQIIHYFKTEFDAEIICWLRRKCIISVDDLQLWSIKKTKKLIKIVSDFFIKLKLNSKILHFWIIKNLLLKLKFWGKN